VELVSDRVPDIFGRSLSILQAYVFSNFRFVQGIATPFTIEHFSNGIKVDEMAFTSVKYNTGVSDDVFLP
jgi:hypothetical protein